MMAAQIFMAIIADAAAKEKIERICNSNKAEDPTSVLSLRALSGEKLQLGLGEDDGEENDGEADH